jgi:hypothetical protein
MGYHRLIVDDFAQLESGLWAPVVGTLAVAGGALQAATAGDWLNEIVSNGNMETGDPPTGWSAINGAVLSSVVEERLGGAGARSLQIVRSAASNFPGAAQNTITIPGANYGVGLWKRNIDAGGVGVYATFINALGYYVGTDWLETSVIRTATAAVTTLTLSVNTSALGQAGLFDDVSLYRQNTLALRSDWHSPNFNLIVDLPMPAAPSEVPYSRILRYTDTLNYWEIRVSPNTAGNDLQIIQVTAGVETVRAQSDVDWTAGATDQLWISAEGATIATWHKKSGAGVWTAGPSYASATQGQTSPLQGVMFYGTALGRESRMELWI